MTFVGTIHIHQLPLFDLTMFNMIHEPSQPIADIIKDIQIVYESTVPDIKAVVPDVMKIKVLPNSIERYCLRCILILVVKYQKFDISTFNNLGY